MDKISEHKALPDPPGAILPDAHTRLLLLLGHPVEHSLSPRIHNTALRALGLNAVYLAADVRPERLAAAVAGLRALGCAGANVTIPHKEAIAPLLDGLTDVARAVGAVNTLLVQADGALLGDNTDVAGFLAPLEGRMAALAGGEAVVLGAGGAARAACCALLGHLRPARLTLVARNTDRARRLADALAPLDAGGVLHVAAPGEARAHVRDARLLVNATPAGMWPDVDATPWADASDFGAHQTAYDLIYNPALTRWLREAAARGAATLGGLDMLIGQAAAAFRQWTGAEMPLEAVRAALVGD